MYLSFCLQPDLSNFNKYTSVALMVTLHAVNLMVTLHAVNLMVTLK